MNPEVVGPLILIFTIMFALIFVATKTGGNRTTQGSSWDERREPTHRVSWDQRREPTPGPWETSPGKWENVMLEPDERILEVTRPSALWVVMFWLLATAIFPLAMFIAPIAWWVKTQHKYAITNKRILVRTGVFNKTAMQMRRERVTDVMVIRPFWVWFWHNGKVLISTAGGPGAQVTIPGQMDPDRIANAIRDAWGVA